MKIEVNEQTQRFYLAQDDRWEPVVGNEIKVGKYRFCAIPLSEGVNVSEVTSGAKVINIPMNFEIGLATQSKEGSIKFFYKIGKLLKGVIENKNTFDIDLAKVKQTAIERLGEMPSIENVDNEWMFADESDVLN